MAIKFGYIAHLQQHNILLAMLCQHMDIKASIFLSFVAVMLFAYGFGMAGSPIVFVLALAFAVAYPIRIGARMLASKPIKTGIEDLGGNDMLGDDPNADACLQKQLVRGYRAAISHNSKVLKSKHRDNMGIIITSLLLFGYVMLMNVVVRFIESPGAGLP